MKLWMLVLGAGMCVSATAIAQPVLITAPQVVNPTATTIRGTGSNVDVPLATAEITVRGTTLTMNGAFTIASLKLEQNATLTHARGASFDPGSGVVNGLWLSVTGSASTSCGAGVSMCIDAGSAISANGGGFLGGQGPGAGQNTPNSLGTPGGGFGGDGGVGTGYGGGRMAYGASVSGPTEFGSGGGNDSDGAGGAGGGVIRVDVHGTLMLNGEIRSDGVYPGSTRSGGGSGGSVWIAADTFAGVGLVHAHGGTGGDGCCSGRGGGGGGGRIAVTYGVKTFTGQVVAFGGPGAVRGGAGTVYEKANAAAAGTVVVNNGGSSGERTVFPGDTFRGDVVVSGAGRLGPTYGQSGWRFLLDGNMTVAADGSVDAGGRGYAGGQGPGAGQSVPNALGTPGGGFGGDGGWGTGYGGGRLGYGASVSQPTELGSGGGNDSDGQGGTGGGALGVNVSGTLRVDGHIHADGLYPGSTRSGGGSGGSVWVTAGTLTGTGVIHANGGVGGDGCCSGRGGGGGGGRVAVWYNASTFGGQMQAFGGAGAGRGGAGTIYQKPASGAAVLLVSNGGSSGERTMVPGNTFVGNMTIRGQGRLGPTYGETGWHFINVGDMTIDSDGFVDAYARGFGGGLGFGAGQSSADGLGTTGGGFGGRGGAGSGFSGGGLTYGSSTSRPIELGSGGGNDADGAGGAGGGALRLSVSGTLTVNGQVHADGQYPGSTRSGGGSGGSVWVTAGTLTGGGSIHANGGRGGDGCCSGRGGGGGGGRVAVYACSRVVPFPAPVAAGGNGAQNGAAGTTGPANAGVTLDVTPSRMLLCRRGDVSFSVVFTPGGPGATYQWTRNGVELEDGATGTGSVVEGTRSAMLTVRNAGALDVGDYRVSVIPGPGACSQLASTAGTLVFCHADFNCDGVVNSQDFFNFVTAFFQSDASADYNGDGVINSQDFFDFLSQFFVGC